MKPKRIIFAVCYLAYMSIYAARVNLSVVAPELKRLSVLTATQLGVLGSAFSCTYALGRLINGTLSDNVRPTTMIFIGLVVTGLSNVIFAAGGSFAVLMIFWIMNAYGQSMLWSSLLRVMDGVYGDTAKRANSYLVTSVASGNIVAIILASFILAKFDVRWAFIIPGVVSITLGAVCLIVLGRIDVGMNHVRTTEKSRQKMENLKLSYAGKEILPALIPTFFHGAIKDNVTLWMGVIAAELCGIDTANSMEYILLIPSIGFVGRLAYPLCYRLIGKRENLLSCGAFLICALAATVLICCKKTPVCVMFMLGLIYAAASMINTSMVSIYPTRFAKHGMLATVSGLMDFVTYLGAGVGATVYGVLAEKGDYEIMFASWTAISLISALVLTYLQRHGERMEEKDDSGN